MFHLYLLYLSSITLLVRSPVNGESVLDLISSLNKIKSKIISNLTNEVYDFIVVGAGSGGSTVANRLSESGEWRVLLLEAGNPEGIFNQVPILVSYFQMTDYNWGYKVEPQENACLGMYNQQCPWPRGKSLGGTSTLNYMIHTRGNRLDYDWWAQMGNQGWSYEEVLPYFKQSENFKVPGIKNSSYHGTNGYLCVEHVPYHSEMSTAFLKAGRELGYKINDPNGENQIGFSYIQVNMEKGARCSAATAYLRAKRPNLEIMIKARVTKILINDNKQAFGVEFTKEGKRYRVFVRREVILSAGTIDSPKLLMLSGIGPKEHLEELGIPVIQDLQVGYNLYEHVGFLGLTIMVNKSVSLFQSKISTPRNVFQYLIERNGPLSIPGGAEALAFIRTKYAPDSRPDVELLFASGSLNSDGGVSFRKSIGVTDELYNTVYKPIENKDAVSIWPIVQYPRSVGRLKLRSNNPFHAPIIETNFFHHPADIEIILEGLKHALEIIKTDAFQAYGARLHDIKIPGCVNYEFASDDYWRCAIKHLPSMMNHELGTVKMGPENDPSAVVDPQLRVYGIERLRVVDASVMPTMTVGHINAGIYMVGEKGADMIKQTWMEKQR